MVLPVSKTGRKHVATATCRHIALQDSPHGHDHFGIGLFLISSHLGCKVCGKTAQRPWSGDLLGLGYWQQSFSPNAGRNPVHLWQESGPQTPYCGHCKPQAFRVGNRVCIAATATTANAAEADMSVGTWQSDARGHFTAPAQVRQLPKQNRRVSLTLLKCIYTLHAFSKVSCQTYGNTGDKCSYASDRISL